MSDQIIFTSKLMNSLKLPCPLRPYQWEGIQFLANSKGALLADEMGLGKTVQVAVSLEILWRKLHFAKALVIVPASLKLNWEKELRRWAPSLSIQRVRGDSANRRAYYHLPIDVVVASYEEIRLDVMCFVNDVAFNVVVLDEAQRIKNLHSKSALACRLLNRNRSWALSGTPVENKPSDLISIFRFVKIGMLSQGLSRSEIHRRIKPHFLRRCKREVLNDLPPIIDQEIPIELSGKQRDAYLQAWGGRWKSLNTAPQDASLANLFAIITRLKQLCNYDPTSGESAKLNLLQNLLEGQRFCETKIIVFSQYVETLKWLTSRIKESPLEIFHGGLDPSEREQVLDRFRKESGPRCLLMSLRAGGVGLNLQEATTVVLFDRWWNPAVENQAVQRAHRFGRKTPLHVIRFIVLETIEKRISKILEEKQQLFENYVEVASSADTPTWNKELLEKMLEVPTLS